MTPRVSFSVLSMAGSLALMGTSFAAAAPVTVPEPVDKLMRAGKECLDYNASHLKNARVAARVGENQMLYLLPCFTGAYNMIYRVFVFDKRYPSELKRSVFAGYSDETGWFGQDQLINAHYDPKTKILSAFEKGRGLGDCGAIPEFRWVEYGWRMMSYRYWGNCDGTRMPKDWPVIYRFNKPRQ
jgi:hypothetical protein